MIAIEGVEKRFRSRSGESQQAIADISLRVASKQFVCIIGPSGCGKSTLLRLIAGLIPPSSGKIYVTGDEVRGPRRDIGFVFQSPVLLPWRNILGNVLVPAEVFKFDRQKAVHRATSLLNLVGLADFANRYPSEVSGGMRQRVAIARALMHDPGILLMDEPFGALDALTREAMNIELLRIWELSGKTVILVTHSIEEALLLSDRVAVMTARPGRILDDVPVALPRPRSADSRTDPAFVRLAASLRAQLQPQASQETAGTGLVKRGLVPRIHVRRP